MKNAECRKAGQGRCEAKAESRKQKAEIEAGDRAKPGKADQSHTGAKAECRMQNAEKAGEAAQSHHRAKAESRKQKAERQGNADQRQVQAWYRLGTS
jgi:hypothetical protein